MATQSVDFIAAVFSFTSIVMAIWHIAMHLANYTEPTFQRYTVRIVFMVPVFALMSFLSLLYREAGIYFDSLTAIYEAFVIYNFLSLCLAWVGGPGAVVQSLQGRLLKPSWHLMTCCLNPITLDGVFIRRCKQGGLQFVIIKPLLVAATFMLYALDLYDDGDFSATSGYLYITLIYTVSYSVALYVLVLFYVACSDLLRPFKALPKFIIIKSVVFLTYWQGVGIYVIETMGYIKTPEDAEDAQNFLVCFEMLLAAIGHVYAFPYKQYAEANIRGSGNMSFWASAAHALSVNDVVHDTFHQFAPTYHDYVLYSDGSQEAPMRYRARTFVRTGQEMDTLHKHSKMFGAGSMDPSSFGFNAFSGSSFSGTSFNVPSFASFSEEPGQSPSNHQYSHQTAKIAPLPQRRSSSFGSFQAGAAPTSFRLPPPPSAAGTTTDGRSDSITSNDGRAWTRRASQDDEAMEASLLPHGRRKSSHGILLDEIDIHGEDYQYEEGYIQR